MAEATLPIEYREPGKARRLRREGYVPAIVYGRHQPSQPIRVRQKDLDQFLKTFGRHHLVQLKDPEGQVQPALVKEVQIHPLRKTVLHVDFQRVSLDEPVTAEVALEILGEEELEKKGLVLQLQLRELEVESLPQDMPEALPLEVGHLEPGTIITAGDVPLPPGVKLVTPADTVVGSVVIPEAYEEGEETPAEEGEAPQEPAPEA
ncbi:MAG: 50S ribosomal protein L25 [Clostridiales bacterium]|nr:50S ribosomal protein L25 [Clostridiales bacterium]